MRGFRGIEIQALFLTPDPAGIGAADLLNPQSLNRYAYVLNNPLNAVDPTGLYPDPGSDPPPIIDPTTGETISCSIDGVMAPCDFVTSIASIGGGTSWGGPLIPCSDNTCTAFTKKGIGVFAASASGKGAYFPITGPGWKFDSIEEALTAGARWAAAATQDNGVENCGMTYSTGGQYSFTGSMDGHRGFCQPLNATSLVPSNAAADGGYHSHPDDPIYDHERFSGQPGDYTHPAGDTGWAGQVGYPISLGTPGGRIMIYYPGRNCQIFISGSPAGTRTTIPICP